MTQQDVLQALSHVQEPDLGKDLVTLNMVKDISIDGDTSFSGMQIIGWDPAAKMIRSWTFDSKGTFAEATWQQKSGRWFLRNRGTLPDGRSATMINVMKPVDEKSFRWQTIERTAGDELLPNIDEIRIVRR